MAQGKKYEPHTMSEKYAFHSKRAFENHKPAGVKMTAKEKSAFSMGYVKHARDTARAYKFNLALDLGATKKDAQKIANNPNIHFNDKMGCFVQRKK